MMQAIALDDERPALEVIQAFCDQIDTVNLVKTFTRTSEARLYLERHPVGLIFLDINMPQESGLEFARSLSQPSLIVFTTAYSEFASDSYEIDATDYLLKPFPFNRFAKSVQRAYTRWQSQLHVAAGSPTTAEPLHLCLRVDYGLVKLAIANIYFIEGLDNYLKIHRYLEAPLVVRLTMKAIIDKLPSPQFVRIHRSYIVALDKVQSVRNKMVIIGEEELPIGSSYEKDFFNQFMR